jgi:dCTP deaminase
MYLSAQSIRLLGDNLITPFHERTVFEGMTFGLGPCGYDVRIAQTFGLEPRSFRLASTVEHFVIPNYLVAFVKDKSSWARRFVTVQNTVIEPGWRGFLTLELTNHSDVYVTIKKGMPIAQIILGRLDLPTDTPYNGKYQDQPNMPVEALVE